MNETNVFFGHHCPQCGTTIGTAVSTGPLSCPGCGGPMQAAPGGPRTRTLANVECKKCHSTYGMISSVGDELLRCPNCGEPL